MTLVKGFIEKVEFIPGNINSKTYTPKFDLPKVMVFVTLDTGYILPCNIYNDIKYVTNCDITEDFVSKIEPILLGKTVLCSNFRIPGIRAILSEILKQD